VLTAPSRSSLISFSAPLLHLVGEVGTGRPCLGVEQPVAHLRSRCCRRAGSGMNSGRARLMTFSENRRGSPPSGAGKGFFPRVAMVLERRDSGSAWIGSYTVGTCPFNSVRGPFGRPHLSDTSQLRAGVDERVVVGRAGAGIPADAARLVVLPPAADRPVEDFTSRGAKPKRGARTGNGRSTN